MAAASAVLWELLSRTIGIEQEQASHCVKPTSAAQVPWPRLKRRLQFKTLLQDTLDTEPWEREGFDATEEAAMEKAEAMLSLHTYQSKPHMLQLVPVRKHRRMGHPLSWSDEAAALRAELPKHERTSRGVLGFFRTLRLDSRGIAHMDRALLKMKNLQELSLRDNDITQVENVPPRLKLLGLCMNGLEVVGGSDEDEQGREDLRRRARRSLQALSAAHNRIHDVRGLHLLFPGLLVLNLGFNHLTNLSEVETVLKGLPALLVLTLLGNPLSLLKDYRIRLVSACKGLRSFDGLEVEEWEKNVKIPDHHLQLEKKILSTWNTAVAQVRRGSFMQQAHSEVEKAEFIELMAAVRLQKQYRACKVRERANVQRQILRAFRRGELMVMRVSVDWLKLDLPAPDPATLQPPTGKKGEAAKKKAQPVEPAPPAEPVPQEAFTVRLLLPSEVVCVAHTLPYMDKAALMAFNHNQDFQLPVTVGLRDLMFFEGLKFQVWRKTTIDYTSNTAATGGGEVKERRKLSLMARGAVPFRSFFDPALFKSTSGSPELVQELPLNLSVLEVQRSNSRSTSRKNLLARSPTAPAAGLNATGESAMGATLRIRITLNTAIDMQSTSWFS